jgi:NB-ARC domain
MGRPERPLDAASGLVGAFAFDLRELRKRAGSPSYRELARIALFSPSVLSAAASGRALPTLQVTLAFVDACGGDRAAWERRWRGLAGLARTVAADEPVDHRPARSVRARTGRWARPRPAQLPVGASTFVGRYEELSAAAATTAEHRGPLVVTGQVGVGKSAFALRLARQVANDLPDGQLYANLATRDAAGSGVWDVMAGFLRALGVPAQQIPDDPGERGGLYRSLLAQRRVVVLLDDVRDEHQVRPLLAATRRSQILVTSCARLAGLDAAERIDLGVLDTEQALALIGTVAGMDRVSAEPRTSAELVELCDHLPLALNVAARRLAAHPGWTVEHAVSRLRDGRHRLEWLRVGDVDVRARVLDRVRALRGPARRAFPELGVGSDHVTANALAERLRCPVSSAEELLESFVDAGLARATRSTGRYGVPRLVRLAAREQADPPAPAGPRVVELARPDAWEASAHVALAASEPA